VPYGETLLPEDEVAKISKTMIAIPTYDLPGRMSGVAILGTGIRRMFFKWKPFLTATRLSVAKFDPGIAYCGSFQKNMPLILCADVPSYVKFSNKMLRESGTVSNLGAVLQYKNVVTGPASVVMMSQAISQDDEVKPIIWDSGSVGVYNLSIIDRSLNLPIASVHTVNSDWHYLDLFNEAEAISTAQKKYIKIATQAPSQNAYEWRLNGIFDKKDNVYVTDYPLRMICQLSNQFLVFELIADNKKIYFKFQDRRCRKGGKGVNTNQILLHRISELFKHYNIDKQVVHKEYKKTLLNIVSLISDPQREDAFYEFINVSANGKSINFPRFRAVLQKYTGIRLIDRSLIVLPVRPIIFDKLSPKYIKATYRGDLTENGKIICKTIFLAAMKRAVGRSTPHVLHPDNKDSVELLAKTFGLTNHLYVCDEFVSTTSTISLNTKYDKYQPSLNDEAIYVAKDLIFYETWNKYSVPKFANIKWSPYIQRELLKYTGWLVYRMTKLVKKIRKIKRDTLDRPLTSAELKRTWLTAAEWIVNHDDPSSSPPSS
jgi:hypothetical protein